MRTAGRSMAAGLVSVLASAIPSDALKEPPDFRMPTVEIEAHFPSVTNLALETWVVEALSPAQAVIEVKVQDSESASTAFSKHFRTVSDSERNWLVHALSEKYLSGNNDSFSEFNRESITEKQFQDRLEKVDQSFNTLIQYAVHSLRITKAVAYVSSQAGVQPKVFLLDLGWNFPGVSRRLYCQAEVPPNGISCTKMFSPMRDPVYVSRRGGAALLVDGYSISALSLHSMQLELTAFRSDVQIDYITFDPDLSMFLLRMHDGRLLVGEVTSEGRVKVGVDPVLADDTRESQIQNYPKLFMHGRYVFQSGPGELSGLDVRSRTVLWSIKTGAETLSSNVFDRVSGLVSYFDSYPNTIAVLLNLRGERSDLFDFAQPVKAAKLDRPCDGPPRENTKFCTGFLDEFQHWQITRISTTPNGEIELIVCATMFHVDPPSCWKLSQNVPVVYVKPTPRAEMTDTK